VLAARERLPCLLCLAGGSGAAGREVTGEDVGQQSEAIRLLAAAAGGGSGVNEPWKRTVLACRELRMAMCSTSSGVVLLRNRFRMRVRLALASAPCALLRSRHQVSPGKVFPGMVPRGRVSAVDSERGTMPTSYYKYGNN
jgi:hypothetical protein